MNKNMEPIKTKDCLTRSRLLVYLKQKTSLTASDIENIEKYVCEIVDDRLFELTVKHKNESEKAVEAERERIRIAAEELANEIDNYGRVHYTKLIKLLSPTKTDKQTLN